MKHERFRDLITIDQAVVRARLAGRHGSTREVGLDYLLKEFKWAASEMASIEEAYAEGVAAHRSGYPCHCASCHSFTEAMREREYARGRYARRRQEELLEQGYGEADVGKIIDDEIAQGAVLQQWPAVVVRSTKVSS